MAVLMQTDDDDDGQTPKVSVGGMADSTFDADDRRRMAAKALGSRDCAQEHTQRRAVEVPCFASVDCDFAAGPDPDPGPGPGPFQSDKTDPQIREAKSLKYTETYASPGRMHVINRDRKRGYRN